MYRLILFVLALSLFSCNTSEDGSCVDNIEQVAEWKELFDNCGNGQICDPVVFKATYLRVRTVYFVRLTGPLCDVAFITVLLNCEGEIITTIRDFDIFTRDVTNIEMIRKCN